MEIRLLRHATLIVTFGGITLLVDPMLSAKGAMDPVANAANQQRIPLVDLPLTEDDLRAVLQPIDAVLITHHHRDHWDARAVELLPKDIPILCQPATENAIREAGFSNVTPINGSLAWRGVTFHRTGGQHGTGEIGQRMGTVSGFVLEAGGEQKLYIAGDTIWCVEVQQALQIYQPAVVVVNAGAAQFLTGDPITMTAEGVCRVAKAAPSARVIAVHMEAINHCLLTRSALRASVQENGLTANVLIPADGETIRI